MITAAFIIAKALGLTCSWWWVLASFAGDCFLTENIGRNKNSLRDDEY
jgi:hypothetical protein